MDIAASRRDARRSALAGTPRSRGPTLGDVSGNIRALFAALKLKNLLESGV
ncbi:MAG: hypothetical protein Q8N44_21880 [Rubrivivax sp.]|nr:hypothetical protein [Rubrivivax sp.]